MLRICAALAAALLVPGTVGAKELKPKFGDIDGVYYTDVAENREACRQAVQRKIYLCSQNTGFVSNTEDRKYPGCLPIFRRQAGACADHFRSEAYKCRGSGAVRIADFTGFACTVTATVVEEGGEPERAPGIVPVDRTMQARTRANVRSGPGADHARTGVLEAGERVQVTGEAGDWLRIAAPGGAAFVHSSLLVPPAAPGGGGNRAGRSDGACKAAADAVGRISEANEAVARRYRLTIEAVARRDWKAAGQQDAAWLAALKGYADALAAAGRAFEAAGRDFRAAGRDHKAASDAAWRDRYAAIKAALRDSEVARDAVKRDYKKGTRQEFVAMKAITRTFKAAEQAAWRGLWAARRVAARDLKAAVAALCP
ncbi:MAG: SH3 domain-containing protein [Rhodospirillaceae bacterium]|nr:SH3 domain-containing protein [Rhodospirillaceae bacterium]